MPALRSRSKLLSEINIVPLTDVVLVLLVIFMVTSPFLFQGAFTVNLPKAAISSPTRPEALTISVTSGGRVFVEGEEIPLGELSAHLARRLREDPTLSAVLNADRSVPHGTVVGVLSAAYEAGLTRVGIGVEVDSGDTAARGKTSEGF